MYSLNTCKHIHPFPIRPEGRVGPLSILYSFFLLLSLLIALFIF